MLKIVIADDHSVVRAGVKRFLELENDMQIIGEAENAEELITILRNITPDILILDIHMPGKSGFDILNEVQNIRPELKVLFLSMYPEESYALRAFDSGACGYLSKDSKPEELVVALRIIASGQKYVSDNLMVRLSSKEDLAEEKPIHKRLSDREMEILLLIGSGKTISEIAKQISISKTTVSTHRAHILEKMEMHTNAQLIHYVLKNNLLSEISI